MATYNDKKNVKFDEFVDNLPYFLLYIIGFHKLYYLSIRWAILAHGLPQTDPGGPFSLCWVFHKTDFCSPSLTNATMSLDPATVYTASEIQYCGGRPANPIGTRCSYREFIFVYSHVV